jgi:hypothetical protein
MVIRKMNKELIYKHLQKQFNCLVDAFEEFKFINREDSIELKVIIMDKKLQYDLDKTSDEKMLNFIDNPNNETFERL